MPHVFLKSPMNKAQLIEVIQKTLGADATKKQAEEALSAVVEAIKVGVQKSGKVQIMGFGTFATKTRAARTGRNPKTGEAITIPASQTVAFKASSSLKA
jgi:DNA-binding protein HU-beta